MRVLKVFTVDMLPKRTCIFLFVFFRLAFAAEKPDPHCLVIPTSTTSGTITSPGYPTKYPTDFQCDYKIPEMAGYKWVMLQVQYDLRSHYVPGRYYRSDYLLIDDRYYTGYQNETFKLLLEMTPRIHFRTLPGTGFGNFKISYEYLQQDCPVQPLNATYGTMTSPGYPTQYPLYFSCNYNVPEKTGYPYVLLTVEERDLTSTYVPGYYYKSDYIYVGNRFYYGKQNSSFKLLLKTPSEISFRTLSGTGFGKFKISYEYLPQACPVQPLNSTHGIMTSPGYPTQYPVYFSCNYNLPTKSGFPYVLLTIDEQDLTSNYVPGYYYKSDYLYINDRYYTGKFNHSIKFVLQVPPTIYFKSLWGTGNGKFKLSYEYLKEACMLHDINETSGLIQSPGYPYGYMTQQECTYEIPVLGNYMDVELNFSDFQLDIDCSKNYLRISDEKYCGDKLKEKTVHQQLPLTMVYFSTGGMKNKGFKMAYRYIHNACVLHSKNETRGYLQSPGYPKNYKNDYTCTYDFPLNSNYTEVRIKFSAFHLEFDYSCNYDRLTIGKDVYCGTQLQDSYVVKELPVKMTFKTDSQDTFPGFYATYEYIDDDGDDDIEDDCPSEGMKGFSGTPEGQIDVLVAVKSGQRYISGTFYEEGIVKLVHKYDKRLNRQGTSE